MHVLILLVEDVQKKQSGEQGMNDINDYAFIYRNNDEKLTKNHYLNIILKGSGLNTSGIGARIDVTCGEKTYTQECYPSRVVK